MQTNAEATIFPFSKRYSCLGSEQPGAEATNSTRPRYNRCFYRFTRAALCIIAPAGASTNAGATSQPAKRAALYTIAPAGGSANAGATAQPTRRAALCTIAPAGASAGAGATAQPAKRAALCTIAPAGASTNAGATSSPVSSASRALPRRVCRAGKGRRGRRCPRRAEAGWRSAGCRGLQLQASLGFLQSG